MRTSAHFEGGGDRGNNKIGAFMCSVGFGARSAKGKPLPPLPEGPPGGLTEAALAEHMRLLRAAEG